LIQSAVEGVTTGNANWKVWSAILHSLLRRAMFKTVSWVALLVVVLLGVTGPVAVTAIVAQEPAGGVSTPQFESTDSNAESKANVPPQVGDRKRVNAYELLNNSVPLISVNPRKSRSGLQDTTLRKDSPNSGSSLPIPPTIPIDVDKQFGELQTELASLRRQLVAHQKSLESLEQERQWLSQAVDALLEEPRFLRVRLETRPCDRPGCYCRGTDHLWTARAMIGGIDGNLYVAAKVMHADGTPHTTDFAPATQNGEELVGQKKQVAWGKPVRFIRNAVSVVAFECHRDGDFLTRKSCNKPLLLQFEVLSSSAAFRQSTGEDPILKSGRIALKD
jgi:hypothetical protein